MTNTPTNAQLRQFIRQYFSVSELETFCFDYFPEVADEFAPEMPKSTRIQMLIGYCQRRELALNLLVNLEKERPQPYQQTFSTPVTVPEISLQPTKRNPRQIFISHAHQDADLAQQLAADLKAEGYPVWLAPDSILPGEKWAEAISRGLDESGIFVILLTKKSVASKWIQTETYAAIDMEHNGKIKFFSLMVEMCDVPSLWGTYQYISMVSDYQYGLKQLFLKIQTNDDLEIDIHHNKPHEKPSPFIGSFNVNESANGLWILPLIEKILKPGYSSSINLEIITLQKELIEDTLESYGAPAIVVEIDQSPSIILYGVEPGYIETEDGYRRKIRLSEIAQLADEIGIAIQSFPIRIQAPVPGRGFVGIEVPLKNRNEFKLFDGLGLTKSKRRLGLRNDIVLGMDVLGQISTTNMLKNPHQLIVGSSGTGKKMLIHSVLSQLLLRYAPNNQRLVLADSGYLGLEVFEGVPHLLFPVLHESQQIVEIVSWFDQEIERRLDVISKNLSRDIVGYNQKQDEDNRMPFIVFVICDFIDIIENAASKTVKSLINRIIRSGQAVGINAILVSNRSNDLSKFSELKYGTSTHIAFAVNSPEESYNIIECNDATVLLGHGDMMIRQSPFSSAPTRVQSCFVSDSEILDLVHFWKNVGPFTILEQDDDLLAEAISMVVGMEQVSTEVFQREYKISFPRAKRMVDSLIRLGVLEANNTNGRIFDVAINL